MTLIAHEVPICEEIVDMALGRLRDTLLFWRRERRFSQTQESEDGPISSYLANNFTALRRLLQNVEITYPRSQNIRLEPNSDPEQPPVMIQRCTPGMITYARIDSTTPITRGMALCANPETGVLEPATDIDNCIAQSLDTHFNENEEPIYAQVRVIEPFDRVLNDHEGSELIAGTTEQILNHIIDNGDYLFLNNVDPPRGPEKYDKKYPHKCFLCKTPLQYRHALGKAKEQNFTEEQFKKMWKSEVVEFYCCRCFDRKKAEEEGHSPYNPTRNHPFEPLWNRYNDRSVHRCLRVININGEVIYQEEPREVHITIEGDLFEYHSQHTIELNVQILGGIVDGERQYCTHSARRGINTPLPDNLPSITMAREFPEITDLHKLIGIAQIYTRWMMLTPEINMDNPLFPSYMDQHIAAIIENEQITPTFYRDIVESFGLAFSEDLYRQDVENMSEFRERMLWHGYTIGPSTDMIIFDDPDED